MKLGNVLLAGVLVTFGAVGTAQSQETKYTTTTTEKTVTVTGPVVRYEPGKTIVITRSGKNVTYRLQPEIVVPDEVAVGKTVTLYTTGTGQKVMVSRVAYGELEAADPMTGEPVTIVGTVKTFEPTKTITVEQPDGSTTTYTINSASDLPSDVAVGKKVTIYTTTEGPTVVRRVVTIRK